MSLWLKLKMFFASFWTVVFPPDAADSLPIQKLKVDPGFKVELFASGIKGARSMALSKNGVLFVSTRSDDKVYALFDDNKNGKIDKKEIHVIADGLNMPNGVAVNGDDLYIAEISKISVIKDAALKFKTKQTPQLVYNQLPDKTHHGWKYIAFGPDGKLYIPIGAPCNICKSKDPRFASIQRLDLKTKKLEVVARGVRNSVGFDWHPSTKELFFTDNGRDWLGDDQPACELNRVEKVGSHFGYPYCHAGDVADPELGSDKNCNDYVKPFQNLGAHVAPLGMKFYTGSQFPKQYQNQILIAEHGSWNRSKKSGYQVSLVTHKDGKATGYKPLVSGWLGANEEQWGRPVDILVLPDGAVLISDDFAGAIYKLTYTK